MRKKGIIWEKELQQLIVESYRDGTLVGSIKSLPDLKPLHPSDFTIRQILKANDIRLTGKRRKRKPEAWSRRVIDSVVEFRNEGLSIREVHLAIEKRFRKLSVSRSLIVRILDENIDKITYKPKDLSGLWSPEIVRKIVDLYQSGMLISDLKDTEFLREFPVTNSVVRKILKSEKVELTGKKGTLRRWPEELQQKIVDLYLDGCTYEEIKTDPEIAQNNPTDYAIRTVLKTKGITQKKITFHDPISEIRYRRYRDDLMDEKEISMIHKHLASYPHGQQRMVERIGLYQASELDPNLRKGAFEKSIANNARKWIYFFKWGMEHLYDNKIKRRIFEYALEISRAASFYKRSFREKDIQRVARARKRLQTISKSMNELIRELIEVPANTARIEIP